MVVTIILGQERFLDLRPEPWDLFAPRAGPEGPDTSFSVPRQVGLMKWSHSLRRGRFLEPKTSHSVLGIRHQGNTSQHPVHRIGHGVFEVYSSATTHHRRQSAWRRAHNRIYLRKSFLSARWINVTTGLRWEFRRQCAYRLRDPNCLNGDSPPGGYDSSNGCRLGCARVDHE